MEFSERRESRAPRSTRQRQRRLGEVLIDIGDVSEDQVAEGLHDQDRSGERLGRCLVRLGHLTEDGLIDALGNQLGLEVLDLDRQLVTAEVTQILPREFVQQHRILPVELRNGTIRIATANPGNLQIIEDLRLLSSREVEEVLAPEQAICEKIAECYEITVERMIEDLHQGTDAAESQHDLHDIEVMASEPTVVNLVNLVISTAVRERASDIHLVPFEKELELRYRIDGMLQVMPPPPKHLHAALVSRVKIMADMNIAERFIPQDGHIQITRSGKRVDIRVGTMPTIYGESVVMRLLEKDSNILTLEELGLDDERILELERVVEKPHGIFLATGPTGSGKTTSLYAVLSRIYSTTKKILTIEDPVEYELPGVGQIPVRPNRGFTFATGLRAILRQDPDVVMVGEIRDTETAEIAIRAALTGHLVFSTLHTNDSAGAVTRLLDMGVEPFLISSSVEGVLAQRLLRRICSKCKAETPLTDELKKKLEAFEVDTSDGPYYEGEGCDACRQTGYRGRIGLFELLVLSPEVREMIVSKRSSRDIKSVAVRDMLTLRQDGMRKARNGVTTLWEVLRVALDSVSDD